MLDLFIKIYEIFIIKNTSKLGEVKISSVIFFSFVVLLIFFLISNMKRTCQYQVFDFYLANSCKDILI